MRRIKLGSHTYELYTESYPRSIKYYFLQGRICWATLNSSQESLQWCQEIMYCWESKRGLPNALSPLSYLSGLTGNVFLKF